MGVSAFPFHSILGQTVQILDRNSHPNSNAPLLVSVQGWLTGAGRGAGLALLWQHGQSAVLASSPCCWLGVALLPLLVTKDTLFAQPAVLDTALGCLSPSNTGSAAG